MSKVHVKIEINEDMNNESLGSVTASNVNYASGSLTVEEVMGVSGGGTYNALTFSPSLFFKDGVLVNEDKVGGRVIDETNQNCVSWGLTDSNKKFYLKLTFSNALSMEDIVVYGNTASGQFPTKAVVDGTTEIISDDASWVIKFLEEKETHTIEFTEWNRANYNAQLCGIKVLDRYIRLTNNSIKGLSYITQISEGESMTFDIFPSIMSLEVVDKHGELLDLVQDEILKSSEVPLQVFFNDKKLGDFKSTESNYSYGSMEFTVESSDLLNDFEKIKVPTYSRITAVNLFRFVQEILAKYGFSYFDVMAMFSNDMLCKYDEKFITIKSYMNNVYINYPCFEEMSLREFFRCLCQTFLIGGKINEKNKLEFFSLRPYALKDNTEIIHIPLKHQFSSPQLNLFKKNGVSSVVINGYNTSVVKDEEGKSSAGNLLFVVKDGSTQVEYQKEEYAFSLGVVGDLQTQNSLEVSDNFFMDKTNVFIDEDSSTERKFLPSDVLYSLYKDFKGGQSYLTVTVSADNYYDELGNLKVDFKKGEYLTVGMIVQVDKDNNGNSAFVTKNGNPRYWRIISSELDKTGVPFVFLTMQEVFLIANPSGKIETPYYTISQTDLSQHFIINCGTKGAVINEYSDDTYTTPIRTYSDGDIFFTKQSALVNITKYFKAHKDGMEDSEPLIFIYP